MSDPSNHQERLHADLDVVERWLRIIHPPGAIMHISSKGSWAGRRFVDYGAATQHVAELDRSGTEGIYLRMQPLSASAPSGGRGRAIDAATLPCLWGDIDIAGPGHAETNLPPDEPSALATIAHLPEPTYVVRSGGGIYPIWMLDRAFVLLGDEQYKLAADLSERWNRSIAWGHEQLRWKYGTGVHDLARVLRIPGTVNRKAGLERATSFRNGGGALSVAELLHVVDQHETKTLQKSPQRTVSQQQKLERPPLPPIYNDGQLERPGDVYNREAPWEDALGPDFVHIRTLNDGSAEWAWADDPARDVKLTTDRDGKSNAFFFTTSWTLAAQEPHSKFYVYAHRAHAGDLAAATKDVASRFGSNVRREGDDFFSQYESGTWAGKLGVVGALQQNLVDQQHHDAVDDGSETPASDNLDDQLLSIDDLDSLEPPVPIIDGILMRHGVAVLNGRGGSYKSFLALDWALCLATGRAWQGKRVEQLKVLYVAGEGAHGMKARIKAWEQSWNTKIDRSQFSMLPFGPNFLKDPTTTAKLITSVRNGEYGLVVVDTLRRVSTGAEENSTRDMGQVWDVLTRIRLATADGSVLVVAHTPKNGNATSTRGASSIEDDSDTVWHVEKEGKSLTLSCLKQKDAEEPPEMHLSVRAVKVAGSADGSLVIESASESGAFVKAAEMDVLAEVLDWDGPIGATQVAATMQRDKSNVAKTMRHMLARGFLASDGTRYPKYWLTDAGRGLLETGTLGVERPGSPITTQGDPQWSDEP